MRIFNAWLLFFVILSQWVGGLLCFEISYYVEIHRDMNALEQSIAQEVERATNTKSAVKLAEAKVPRGYVYGDLFLFSEKRNDGQTVFYTLEKGSETTTYQKVTHRQENPISDAGKTMLLKSLFQEFVMIQPALPIGEDEMLAQDYFFYADRQLQPFLNTLTPPPNFLI